MKVAVLKGGRGLERQVSLRSGARVEDALAALGHEVVADRRRRRPRRDAQGRAARGRVRRPARRRRRGRHRPGAARDPPASPTPAPASARACASIDKVGAKHDLRAAGVPTPDWAAFNALAFRELGAADALEEIEANLGFPLVIKPAAGGSSLGVRFAAAADEVPEALVGRLLLRRPGPARAPRRGPRAGDLADQRDRAAGGRGACRARRTASTTRRVTRSAAPTTSARPTSAPRRARSSTPPCAPGTCSASTASAAST